MIEAEADDLDLYAELPESVDGYTDYFADRNPKVKISERLSSPRYENRLRMTLGRCQVSEQAARVRLLRLGLLTESRNPPM